MRVTSVVQGKDIVITMKNSLGDYVPFACGSSCKITINRDKLLVRDRVSYNWKKYVQTEKSASIDIDGVVVLYNTDQLTNFDIINNQINGGSVDILCSITDRYGNSAILEATVLIDQSELSFVMGSVSASTITGTINGEPTITYIGSNPAPEGVYVNPYCALEDEDGSYIRDVDGSLIADGDCSAAVPLADYTTADFTSLDFFV